MGVPDNSMPSKTKKPSSLNEMNKTLVLTRGSAWFGVGALLAIMVGIMLAIFLVKVPTHVETMVCEQDGKLVCYVDVDRVDDLQIGQQVSIDQAKTGVVQEISKTAYSKAEAEDQISSDYARYLMKFSEWNVRVVISFEGQLDDETLHRAVITTGEIPLSRMLAGVPS